MRIIEVAAAVIHKDGKILVCQRPHGKSCALLWEFPGGKLEPDETPEGCVVRECREELGVTLTVERYITDTLFEYPDRTVHIRFFKCAIAEGEPRRIEHNAIEFMTPEQILRLELCPADFSVIKKDGFFD